MINYIALVTGLILSVVAGYFSIIGLATIFPGSFWPVVLMGASLELGKVVGASWLYRNWVFAPTTIKYYLTTAIVILSFITSLGTFGYLSKAHIEQGASTSDTAAKVSILDEKIKSSKDNIDVNRKALKQLDEVVDQTMVRSSSEQGAERANQIRKGQAKERTRLLQEIETEQKKISQLVEERSPIAAELRRTEVEVGPVKYVASFLYGETSQIILEKSVTWIIILIVIVFDPLALCLIIAANAGLNSKIQLKNKKGKRIVEIDPKKVMRL